MDGAALPIGPAWCAAGPDALEREIRGARFALSVNGEAVDMGPYPLVRQPLGDGRHCAWVGVASLGQRASVNRFVYTVAPGTAAGRPPTSVEMTVTFKDP
jgi:hypothetical protein